MRRFRSERTRWVCKLVAMIFLVLHLTWIALAANKNIPLSITKRKTDHEAWKIFFNRKLERDGGRNTNELFREDPLMDLNDARVCTFQIQLFENKILLKYRAPHSQHSHYVKNFKIFSKCPQKFFRRN